jgi:hypothetical protein
VSDTVLARPLPRNLEAEASVLGAIVLDNRALEVAVQIVRAEDFFLQPNRRAFECMVQLGEKQQPISPVSMLDHLERLGQLEAVGGIDFLSKIGDGLPRVTNVEHYARIVKEKALLRSLIFSASAIQESAMGAAEDAGAIIQRAESSLAQLREQVGHSSWRDLFDTWEEFQNTKPLRSLIENIFQADVCNIVGGKVGDGKTLTLLAYTRALLTGKPLFGYFKVPELAARVVYLIPECARAPFFHRAKLFGLEKYIENDRFLVRTLSKGPRIPLSDPRLMQAVKGAVVMIDTAVRFVAGEENDAGTVSDGLATDIFTLLAAGAVGIGAAHHAPKSFEKENRISLENILRGSGDFGAFVGAGFGIRQIDQSQNVIHFEDIKPRDAEPFPPFQIIGRPFINEEGDFRMHRKPNDCGRLADYLEIPGKNKGGAPARDREARSANIALMRGWLKDEPLLSSTQLSDKFAQLGIKCGSSAIRKYRKELDA